MREYDINELCTVKSSKRIYASDYVHEGVPFFRGKEITEMAQNKAITEILYISTKRYEDINNKYGAPRIGDILMTAVGTLGNVWKVNSEPIYFKDGNLIWFSDFKEEIVNPDYLKLLFESKSFQMNLMQKGTIGSVQSALTIEKVKRIKISLPSVSEQREIVEKINTIINSNILNYDIIANLLEYSNVLFYKWFVDFNFPDKNGKPFKDAGGKMVEIEGKLIPLGWKKTKIDYLVDKQITGDWGKDGPEIGLDKALCVRGADLPNWKIGKTHTTPLRYIDIEKTKEKQFMHGDIMIEISGGSPIQSTGRVITIRNSALANVKHPVYCSNFSKIIRPKDIKFSMFLVLALQKLYDRGIFFHYESKTTGIKNLLLTKVLDRIEIIIPDLKTIDLFNEIVEPIYDKINYLGHENKLLEETRDLLIKNLII